MTLVIDATAGGASANSFVTLAEAQAYVDGRLNSDAWGLATVDQQNRALAEATRDITVLDFNGRRSTSTQALQWPRWGAPDPDSAFGWYFDSTIVPTRVKTATCELAYEYINAGTTDIAIADPNAGVIESQVDVLVTRWAPFSRPVGLSRYPRVMQNLAPLLSSAGASTQLIRG